MTVVLLSIFTILYYFYYNEQVDIVGVYISEKPNLSEKTQIMYSRGYFNFSYNRPKELKLAVNSDSTFKYYLVKQAIETIESSGKWNVKKDKLILKNSDTTKGTIEFTISNGTIYRIREAILCEGRKEKVFFDFLKKEKP